MIGNGKYAGVKDVNVTPSADNNLSIWQQTKIRESYMVCAEKGVAIPDDPTLENLPSCISQIDDRVFIVNNGVLTKKETFSSFPATIIGERALYFLYYKTSVNISKVDMSSVEDIKDYGCYSSFYGCAGLTSVKINNLRTVGTYGLNECFRETGITSISFDNLNEIPGNYGLSGVCYNCTGLTSVLFPKLTSITGNRVFNYAFRNTAITSLSFPKLKTVSNSDQFANMLYGVTGCTVHFLSSLEATMGDWASVLNGFGGTNTTVLFDLEEE